MTYIKNCLITLLLIITPLVALAKVPNEDDILDQITDPASQNYYPNLYIRFTLGDSTLTADNYHYLYYGFVYQENYRPLEVNNSIDKVLMLAASIDSEKPNVGSLDNLIIAVDEALELNPFSPQLWNLLSFAYGSLGDTTREEAAYNRVISILQTIDDSGSGLKKGTPKHIIMFDHATDYLTSKSLTSQSARIVDRAVEYIPFVQEVDIDGKKRKGLFFDYSRIYRQKPDGYEYKRDKSWQLNNLEPWRKK